jgi:hypothetical protein
VPGTLLKKKKTPPRSQKSLFSDSVDPVYLGISLLHNKKSKTLQFLGRCIGSSAAKPSTAEFTGRT